jgi:hypothetical protein
MVKKKVQPELEHFTIVGMQYRLTKQARRMLSYEIPISVVFRREPKNQHDPNAIAVFIADKQMLAGQHIGYLRRGVAEVLAPKIDAKEITLPAFGIIDSMRIDEGTAEVQMKLLKLVSK